MGITKGLLFGFVGLLLCGLLVVLNNDVPLRKNELKQILLSKLVRFEPIPIAAYSASSNRSDNAIYVLGGSPKSLQNRFKKAAELYKEGLANKILVDSDQMMMEYSPSIGRNLTFNEWQIGELVGLGIEKKDIEPVLMENGFFGTFSEAKSIAKLVSNRGYRSLILVSSDYHTRRVWYCFSKLIVNNNVNLYVYPSNDVPSMSTLMQELVKSAFYRIFL